MNLNLQLLASLPLFNYDDNGIRLYVDADIDLIYTIYNDNDTRLCALMLIEYMERCHIGFRRTGSTLISVHV